MPEKPNSAPSPAPSRASARSRLQVDERREQLLRLGIELFGDRSYDEISVDEIARAAGVSKGLLYHYFHGKRGYYVAAIRYAADQLVQKTEEAGEQLGAQTPSLEGLTLGLRVFLDYVERHGNAYSTLLRGGLGTDAEVMAIVEDVRLRFIAGIVERLGVDPPPPPLRMMLRGWIGFVEAVSLDWLDHRDAEVAEVAELLARTLAAVLLAQGVETPLRRDNMSSET
ncbi:MAG: TetR/AcrR family transcriptional regulator [Myxococcales bacterium]|nr:TetR/AcrR family transcriptional regulator [Myxococcales bacterium]